MMPQTRRAQVLMEPEEYRAMEEIAAREGVSVAELFRAAVRKCYLSAPGERVKAVEAIAALGVPLPSWKKIEEELSDAHEEAGVP